MDRGRGSYEEVQEMMREEWVFSPAFADWVFSYVGNSSRVYLPNSKRLVYMMKSNVSQNKLFREGDFKVAPPGSSLDERIEMDSSKRSEWTTKMNGTIRTTTDINLEWDEMFSVEEVVVAGTFYTNIGSWYTFEALERRDGRAKYDPIRVPIPMSLEEDLQEWVDTMPGASILRRKGVEFDERFAEGISSEKARSVAQDLIDYHVRVPVKSTGEAKTVFKQATQFAERGVRAVR